MTKYPRHPLSTCFPLMTGEEYWGLVDDIKARGLEHDIVLYEGKVLDGSNRERACIDAGVEPRYTEFAGGDPLAYVISVNLKRRHLNESQRGIAASRLKESAKALSNHKGLRASDDGRLSTARAAKLFNVGESTVERADEVRAAKNSDLEEAVVGGELSVTRAAELAQLTREQQADALNDIRNKPKKKATPEQRDRMMTREIRLTESDLVGLAALYELGVESDQPRAELGANVLKRIVPAVEE